MAKIAGRSVKMFRCHYDVMIGPKAMKAYFLPGPECRAFETKAWVNDQETGVFIKLIRNAKKEEHFVPLTNIEAIQFFEEEEKSAKHKSQAV